jgi:hypothetical protein
LTPSPALLAAQERLLALREKYQAEQGALLRLPSAEVAGNDCVGNDCVGNDCVGNERVGNGRYTLPNESPPHPPLAHPPMALPDHLGWESAAVTAVLRQSSPSGQATPAAARAANHFFSPEEALPHPPTTPEPTTAVSLRVYPDLALAILRQEQAAPARVWYLLRHLDETGCGWLEETAVRHHLADSQSPLRLCGRRQLRNLLNEGEGLFWERRNGRIWLRSLVKVAVGLEVNRLQGRPVAVPLTHFISGIGAFRAHLYATFHSGRGSQDQMAGPIARETLANLSHVPPRTQRLYEAKARVKKAFNFALGQPVSTKTAQNTRWQKGHSLFELTDYRGKHGPAGAKYLAWQLPNSYNGPHPQQQNGRQKRLNQSIADLLPIGMTGNDDTPVAPARLRRYCRHGQMAARLYNRSPRDFYWPTYRPTARDRGIWYVLNQSNKS